MSVEEDWAYTIGVWLKNLLLCLTFAIEQPMATCQLEQNQDKALACTLIYYM